MTPAAPTPATWALPKDDTDRDLVVAAHAEPNAHRIYLAGDTYTILVSGANTAGRYCLIDMIVPDGGGPAPHRHDFEEAFTLLEGELEFTFRGTTRTISAPASVAIPANAPHAFRNRSGRDAHMLCLCAPAGQEEFFAAIGDPVADPGGPTVPPDEAALVRKAATLRRLARQYRTEFLD